jgi:streptogramin lyase
LKEKPRFRALLVALAAVSCGSSAAPSPDGSVTDGPNGTSDTAMAAAPDAASPDTGEELTYRCDNLPPLPWAFTLNTGPPRSEDFTFDNDGYLLALSKNNLVRLANGGQPQLVAADVAISGTGVRVLGNGDIVVADEVRGAVIRLTAAGDRSPIGTTYIRGPNGIQLGPGGLLYVTDLSGGNLYRLDPVTGATTLLSFVVDDADGLVFSNDYKTLFVGSFGLGELYKIPVNDDGTVQPPVRLANGFNGPDGITIDECGNIYLASYNDGSLRRVTPDGKVELVAALSARSASAVNFGSGRQGWDARTIYVMNYQDGGMFEVRAGVRGAPPPPGRP